MNDLYDRMLTACMKTLYEGDRRQISVDLLQRIVAICAEVAAPIGRDTEPDDLQFIKASMLRPWDLIWRPDSRAFAEIRHIEQDDNVGLFRVEFTDGTATWYAGAEPLQVPLLRAHAQDWNERQRIHQAALSADD